MRMRTVLAAALVLMLAACSGGDTSSGPYGAQQARIGESLTVAGWNVSVANLRFDADRVLVDIDAAPAQTGGAHVKPESLRLGLYGALAHPIESNAIGGCADAANLGLQPAAMQTAGPEHLSGTVCLGPLRDQSQVRGGVYLYSPEERIPKTTVAWPAAFPVADAHRGGQRGGSGAAVHQRGRVPCRRRPTRAVRARRSDGLLR